RCQNLDSATTGRQPELCCVAGWHQSHHADLKSIRVGAAIRSACPHLQSRKRALHPRAEFLRTDGQRYFSPFGEVSVTPAGHSAPWSIHPRNSATSAGLSAGDLCRTALGGISDSGTLPET